MLRYATEDVPAGILAQMTRWIEAGSLVDRTGLLDYRLALADARVPLLVVSARGDAVCPAPAADAALETWGHADAERIALPEDWGHLDVLLSPSADDAVSDPLVSWLAARRRRAW